MPRAALSARCGFALLAAGLLPACSLLRPAPVAAPLAPASYGGSAQVAQVLTFSHGDTSVTLQSQIDITPERIVLVGTSALGQRLLSLRYDAAGLHAESALPAAALDPAQVLLDLQLAGWPLAALQAGLGARWQVTEPAAGTRRVTRDGQPYAEIHYAGRSPWRGRLWLVNWPGQYSLTLDSHPLK